MCPPFRKKGLPTYELMCGLFSAPISKRKYHHVSTTNLLDTDHEREVEDGLIRLGIDDSHDPSNTGAPSTAQSPSTPHTSLDKRGIDLISNIHHHSKRMKGKSVANTNSTVLFKFVNAQNRHNDILEQWMAMKSKSLGMTSPSKDNASDANDLYSKCLLIM